MKEVKIQSKLYVFETLTDTPKDIQNLMAAAVEARNNAYAPYSRFHVGTALLLDNGKIISGSNQENASYPSGLCAERTAIFSAGANYPKTKILKIAITAASQIQKTDKPIPPCGACRQSIAEYENKQQQAIEIYFMGEIGTVMKSNSLANLLPFGFNSANL